MAKLETPDWSRYGGTGELSHGEIVARFLQSPDLRDSLLKYRNETPPSLDPWTRDGVAAITARKNDYEAAMAALLRSGGGGPAGGDEELFQAGFKRFRALEEQRRSPTARRRGRPSQGSRIPWASERLAAAWEEENPKKRAIDMILVAYSGSDFAAARRRGAFVVSTYENGSPPEVRVAARLTMHVLPIIRAWENPRRFMKREAPRFDRMPPRPLVIGQPGNLLTYLPALVRWGVWALWSDAFRAPIRWKRIEDPEVYQATLAAMGEDRVLLEPSFWRQLDRMAVEEQRAFIAREVLAGAGAPYDPKGGRPKGAKTTKGTGEHLHSRRRRLFDEACRSHYENGRFEFEAARLAVGELAASERVTRSAIWKSVRKTGFSFRI